MSTSRQAAKVRTGAKGVDDTPAAAGNPNDVLAPFLIDAQSRARGASTVKIAGRQYVTDAQGKVVFQGKRGLRITIKGSKRVHDPLSNAVFYTRSYMAIFDSDGLYKADPELVDQEDGARIPVVERLTANPYYGIGRDFWLLADMQGRAKATEEQALIERFQANPELLASVQAKLGVSFVSSFAQAAPPAAKADPGEAPPPSKEELAAEKAKAATAPSSEAS